MLTFTEHPSLLFCSDLRGRNALLMKRIARHPPRGSSGEADFEEGSWYLLPAHQPETALISVERKLYENPSTPRTFYVHFQIENLSSTEISVRLDDYSKVIRPNSTGQLSGSVRRRISERRVDREPSDVEELRQLKLSGGLTTISAKSKLRYFAHYPSESHNRVTISQKRPGIQYLFVSLTGLLEGIVGAEDVGVVFSDCAWKGGRGASVTDLILQYPISWEDVPSNANVF